jgi:hypothetical protein
MSNNEEPGAGSMRPVEVTAEPLIAAAPRLDVVPRFSVQAPGEPRHPTADQPPPGRAGELPFMPSSNFDDVTYRQASRRNNALYDTYYPPASPVPQPTEEAINAPTVHQKVPPALEENITAVEFGPGSNGNRGASRVAIQRNREAIVLQIEGLLAFIEHELAAVRQSGANEQTSRLEGLKDQFEYLRRVVLSQETITGETAEKAGQSFIDYIRHWWETDHLTICRTTFNVGMFSSCLGLCALIGDPVAVVISGTLVGGGNIVKALEALSKIWGGSSDN